MGLYGILTTVAIALFVASAVATVRRLNADPAVRWWNPPGVKAARNRWAGRPILAGSVLAAAHLVPVAAAIAASALLSRRLPEPDGWADWAMRWGVLLGTSTAVLFVVDRLARRALPLAALLKLSMVFPDKAPKRLAVARRAGSVRNLEKRLEEAKALGAHDEPTRAAEVILSLVGALHGHDRQTRGHSERVRWFADLIADELKLPQADRDRLRWAALLHDVGKLHVRKRILNKPSKLNAAEWKHIHRHPEEGAKITSPLHSWLGDWSLTIVQHHERYDGTGYPVGLKGEDISLGARIVAVADAYEVMTAVRAYKKAMSAADARKELTRCAGAHFDPMIVRAFLNVSVGRLRWIAGPAAWVGQLPFVGWLPRVADGAVALTGQAAGVVGTAAGAAALSSATIAPTIAEAPAFGETPSNPPALLEIQTPQAPPPTVLGVTIDRSGSVSSSGVATPLPTIPLPTSTTLPNGNLAPGNADPAVGASTPVTAPIPGAVKDGKTLEKPAPGKTEVVPGSGKGLGR